MHIKKLIVKNFKALRDTDVDFNQHLNIIVGDNETGKSTVLEAINLVLTGYINGTSILNDKNPYLFNNKTVDEFFDGIDKGLTLPPPNILIEVYFENNDALAKFMGSNNSLRDNCPGLSLAIEFNEDYCAEYKEYLDEYKKRKEKSRTIPVEYFYVNWQSFAGEHITARKRAVNSTLIDTSLQRYGSHTNKYITKIISDILDNKQRIDLSLSYRKMKEDFSKEENVRKINEQLVTKGEDITDKKLTVSMDLSSRFSWESSLTAHLDEIPIEFAGKGEESCVKMKLAMESSDDVHVLLIEEPENHLSYANMNKLINKISEKGKGKQIIITTHSSFVLNKLGIRDVILFKPDRSLRLDQLSPDTYDYFKKLPGYDTLRLILSQKAILVEGPSDELIVQKAFFCKYNKMPLECNVDIISVRALSFKRFLEIGKLLNLNIAVVTDNDGDVEKLKRKYEDYEGLPNLVIHYDEDENCMTLEPQILKANSLELLNRIFNTHYSRDEDLLRYMDNNKPECALKIFDSTEKTTFPGYINDAI